MPPDYQCCLLTLTYFPTLQSVISFISQRFKDFCQKISREYTCIMTFLQCPCGMLPSVEFLFLLSKQSQNQDTLQDGSRFLGLF